MVNQRRNSWLTLGRERPSKTGANFILRFLLEVVTSSHSLNAALGIHNSLLARIEGVAVTADLYSQDRFGAARFEYVAAGAGYRRFHKLRMNICFHSYFSWIPV